MPSDEEKKAAGQEKAENETPEQELVDQGSAGAEPEAGSEGQYSSSGMPLSGDETAEQEAAEEPEEEETAAGKKEKKFWLLSLGLILLLLVGGGFYAVTGMRQAAHKLGGGSDYDQLSANSSIYDGGAGAARNADYFPLDEDAARAQAAKAAGGGRINAALIRTQAELVAEANGKRPVRETAAANEQEEPPSDERAAAAAPAEQAAMAGKLQARAFLSGGAMGSRSAKSSPAAAAGGTGAFQGNGTVVGRATAQSETARGIPRQAGRSSVMEGMKGAFKATLYGARLSSKDAARSWTARAFDGSVEAAIAIQYDEEMRKLDKVNPDSIPGFLRDQDLSAAGAKTLSASEVAKPKIDKDATKEALAADKDYQAKKMAGELSGGMINNLFKGLPGTEPPTNNDKGGPPSGDPEGPSSFADPEDKQDATDAALADYVKTEGFGGECGCTADAPCCCLPQNTATQNCPMYGPFLPNDPCGATMYGGDAAGDGGLMAGQ